MSALRRLRSAISVGLLWGAGWATFGVALIAWSVLFGGPGFDHPSARVIGRYLLSNGLTFGGFGLVAGLVFALALSRAERGRAVAGLSAMRAGVWGAFASYGATFLVIPLLGIPPLADVASVAGIMGVVGFASAFGTVRLARRGTELDVVTSGSLRIQS